MIHIDTEYLRVAAIPSTFHGKITVRRYVFIVTARHTDGYYWENPKSGKCIRYHRLRHRPIAVFLIFNQSGE